MGREILFRAKDINSGEWVEGYYAVVDGGKHVIISEVPIIVNIYRNSTAIYQIDTSTLCQYMGLTDKNGTKIFDGDIVRSGKKGFLVSWKGRYASWALSPVKGWRAYRYFGESLQPVDFEVVGNRFDNPEMLEGGEKNNG